LILGVFAVFDGPPVLAVSLPVPEAHIELTGMEDDREVCPGGPPWVGGERNLDVNLKKKVG
jgi:hypothetical protein